ncbi:MAG TPA: hypothetical protein VN445_06515 [Rectinemataceae bacterium]|nr:hypothetical protein [Rectinemataceae bacterium]
MPGIDISCVVDEAFALILPKTAQILARLPDGAGAKREKEEKAGQPAAAVPLPLTAIEETAKKLLGQWSVDGSTMPKALIASPLMASRLVSLSVGRHAPTPRLVVPFAAGFRVGEAEAAAASERKAAAATSPPATTVKNAGPGGGDFPVGADLPARGDLRAAAAKPCSIEYDYEAAFSAMGKKAARYLRKASKANGNSGSCGLVFQENFMRGKAALNSFIAAFEAEIGEGRLVVRVLERDRLAVDPSGATKEAITRLIGARPADGSGGVVVVVLAIDDPFVAESVAAGSRADGSLGETGAAAEDAGALGAGVANGAALGAGALGAGAASTATAGAAMKVGADNPIFIADQSSWGEARSGLKPGLFRYRIWGNEAGLARAAIAAAKDLAEGLPVEAIRKVALRRGAAFPRIF